MRPLLTDVALHKAGQYFLQTQAALIAALGVQADANKRMATPQHNSNVPSLAQTTNIGVLVSSGRALKRIEPEKLAAIVSELLERIAPASTRIVLIGGPGDQALAQSIVAQLTPVQHAQVEDAVGRYALSELPSLLIQLSMLIGVDSGVTHMADALGVPIVCVAGPVDLNEVYQTGETRQRITADIPCCPCSTVFDTPSQCHAGHMACLRQLNTDKVVQTALTLVAKVGKQ